MSWSNKKGFNFRDTLGYVTDGTNETAIIGSSGNIATAYPTSKTIDGDTFDVGWASTGADGARDRSTGVDVRVAGCHFMLNDGSHQNTFRVDLPSAGTYEVTLAMGDQGFGRYPYWQIVDDTTVLETVDKTGSPTSANEFYDATGVKRTSASDWATNNVAKQYTFASTIFRIRVGTPSSSTDASTIAHLGLRSVAGSSIDPFLTILFRAA